MVLRYILFIFIVVTLSFTAAFYVKAPTFEAVVFDMSNDPLAKIKKSYAKMIWNGAEKEKN